MQSKNKAVLVLYKASGRKVSEILNNFSNEIKIYTVIKPKNIFLSKLVNNLKDLDSDTSNVYFMPTEDDHIKPLYPFFLGFKNINGYQYADTPDFNGQFNRRALTPAADQFFFVGFFWTISEDGKDNQLDNL